MSHILIDAFRHHTWATRHLLEFCRDLPDAQLTSSAAGTYGDILATFNHIVLSDAAYLRRLTGSAPAWLDRNRPWPGPERDELGSLEELAAWVDDTGQRWQRFLSEPFDAEQVYAVNNGVHEVYGGVLLAQVFHHANAHREQICAILTGAGLQPPDVQPWAYAWATNRIWEHDGDARPATAAAPGRGE